MTEQILDVEVNTDAVEPKDYFKVLKAKKKSVDNEFLQNQLETVAKNILLAKDVGQTSFINLLSFSYDTIIKEQKLLAHGIKDYMLKEDIRHLLDTVKPADSIKIIELERFPRAIPEEVLEKIKEAQDLEIFDGFVVVFTDLTQGDYTTKEEKAFVAKNRDPVVFGYFRSTSGGFNHDRFYYIADWEDEHCDLTYGRMIDKMTKIGIKNPGKIINVDHSYISQLVQENIESMNKKHNNGNIGFTMNTIVETTVEPTVEKSPNRKGIIEDIKNSIKNFWDKFNEKVK